MEFCNTFLKHPANFLLIALAINNMLACFHKSTQRQIYNSIANTTSIVCLVWLVHDLVAFRTISISIAGFAWFINLVMAVYATMIIKNDFTIDNQLFANPISHLMDIIYDDDDRIAITRTQKTLLKMSAITLSVLWLPIVAYWSMNNCFIDGMVDMSNPFGMYATIMISLMYLNFVSCVTKLIIDIDIKLCLIFVAYYNINFAVVMMFVYIV